jgi:hypothetical protein
MARIIEMTPPYERRPDATAFDDIADRILYRIDAIQASRLETKLLRKLDANARLLEGHIRAEVPRGDKIYVDLLDDTNELIDDFCHNCGLSKNEVVAKLPIYFKMRMYATTDRTAVIVRKVVAALTSATIIAVAAHHVLIHHVLRLPLHH